LPSHISIILDDLHILHILLSHVICINPQIHIEYEKCGIIKSITLIIFHMLFLSLVTSFNMKKPIQKNIPVDK